MVRTTTASINKRSHVRKAANGRGRVVFPDQRTFLDCTILDTSTTGARIRLSHKRVLPQEFYLLNMKERTVHKAEVAWEKAEHVGLRFTESHILDSGLPHGFDFMRKHWLECALR